MNADQIAQIRPALREVAEGAPDTCATLEVEGDPDKWVQVVDRTVNAAYPHSDHPEARVLGFIFPPLFAQVVTWESGKFATFEFAEMEVDAVSEWIDAYFVRVIGCTPGGYTLDVAFEKL